jgi:hypothetical protein
MSESSPRRRPARRSPWPRRAVIIVLVVLIFAIGVALGQALNDGPPGPSTQTYVRTLEPVPQTPGTTTTG